MYDVIVVVRFTGRFRKQLRRAQNKINEVRLAGIVGMSPDLSPREPEFRVRVTKDHLVFSAAHFITYNGNVCERLHGHNWRVAVEVWPDRNISTRITTCSTFISAALTPLQRIVSEPDHRMLFSAQTSQAIRVEASEPRSDCLDSQMRCWVFPPGDRILLPVGEYDGGTPRRLDIGRRLSRRDLRAQRRIRLPDAVW